MNIGSLFASIDLYVSENNPLARVLGSRWHDFGRWIMWHLIFFLLWIFLPAWACGLLAVFVGIIKERNDSIAHGGITYDSVFDFMSDCLPQSLGLAITFSCWWLYFANWFIVLLLYPLRWPRPLTIADEVTGEQVFFRKFRCH
jgi:hypothetical protein